MNEHPVRIDYAALARSPGVYCRTYYTRPRTLLDRLRAAWRTAVA